MASNFKVYLHKNSESLHLKLEGDFDSNSAYEVINLLSTTCTGRSKVFIHTACLKSVDSWGRDIFLSHLNALKKKLVFLVFTGDKASELVPDSLSSGLYLSTVN